MTKRLPAFSSDSDDPQQSEMAKIIHRSVSPLAKASWLPVAMILALLTPLFAQEQGVEAVVFELPNKLADPLVAKGRDGSPEPWEKVITPEGRVVKEGKAKLIARFFAKDLSNDRADHLVSVDEGANTNRRYYYRVDTVDGKNPRRMIDIALWINDAKAPPLEKWHIDLASPLTAEWSFSARHRTADGSRIVLERSPDFAKLEDQDTVTWTALRLLKRDGPVGKRETELVSSSFDEDPDETYRVEWRHRKSDLRLSHEDTIALSSGRSVIDVDQSTSNHLSTGERSYLYRKSGELNWSLTSKTFAKKSGSKIKLDILSYDSPHMEKNTLPIHIQRPAAKFERTWKKNLAEDKERSSHAHVQLISG